MQIVCSIVDAVITDKETTEFEHNQDISLPEDYRDFLLKNNGGEPQPNGFTFRTEFGKEENSLIDKFFSLSSTGLLYSIEENLHEYKGRIPERQLPIACDPFGNLVL